MSDRTPRAKRRWTETEDAAVRQLGEGVSADAIAKSIGRSEGAVWKRAWALGMKKEPIAPDDRPRKSSSLAAEARFLAMLAAVGAVSLEPVWTGTGTPHLIRCAKGHEVTPCPGNVLMGNYPCRTCAGRDSAATEARFRALLAEMGAELLDPWTRGDQPHRVRCASGHITSPQPTNVLMGNSTCRACAGHDPVNAEAKFRALLTEFGVILLEYGWLGSRTRHRAQCADGHLCFPRPSDLLNGHNPCRACVGQDPAINRARFEAVLAEFGAVLLEPNWLGTGKPHRVRCAAGHITTPRPDDIYMGSGVCRTCSGMAWDAFYVVADQDRYRIKFGITTGDPGARLRAHRYKGYREVVRLLTDLPESVALEMERAVRATLKMAGVMPVQGREYHDSAALALVLDVVDNYPASSG